MDLLRAAVAVGQEAGRALVGPFHRPAQRLCGVQDADIFGIVDVLHAERAADIGRQQVNLLVRNLQDVLGEIDAVAGDALGRNLDRVAVAGLVIGGKPRARLHRHDGDAGVDDIELCHMRGAGERGFDLGGVAIVIIQRHVVGDVIVKLRRAGLCGFLGIGDGGQRIDVDHDGLAGIACLRQRLGHHERDGIADIAHLVGHQRGAVGLQQRRAVPVFQRQAAGEGAVVGGGEIGSGPDPEHAGHGLGGRGVDAADDAVGMGRAHDPGIGLARAG